MSDKIEFQITVTKDGLSTALKDGQEEAKKTAKAIEQINSVFGDTTKELSRIKSSFVGNLGANAVQGAFNLLGSAIGATVTSAREYSRAIAEVNSILPKNTKLTEDQTKAFIALSSQYGKTAQSEAKAFYEIVSGGIENTSTAFKILRQANDAAVAGLTDVNIAGKVLTSTFNAFSSQGVSVTQVSDALFQAIKDGQTTFEELSGTLGRVSSIANSAGLTINDVAGSIAFLTKSGVTSDQAITGLRATVSSIIKPSKEAADEANRLGIAFNVDAIKKAGGFANFLDQVRIASNGSSTSIARLFGDVNAINTVVTIAGKNFGDFKKTLDQNVNSLGATAKASKEIKDSFDFKAGQAEQSIKNLATTFAVFLLPALNTTLEGFKALTGIAKTTVELDENRKKLKELAIEYNNTKDAIDIYAKGLGATAQEILFANKIIKSQADGEKRLNEILKERQDIRSKIAKPTTTETDPPPVDPAIEAQAVASRLETFNQLALARANFDATQDQLTLERKTLDGTAKQEDLDAVIANEKAMIDAKYASELEKTKLITDAITQRQAIEAIEYKKKEDLQKISGKRDIDFAKAQLNLRRTLEDQKNQIIMSSFGLASALTKDGSKEQFLIQKASALAEIAIARGKAIAMIPAQTSHLLYPANIAPSAQLLANANLQAGIGTATVLATALKGFANGGIIGATNGPDNTIATVRTGEMVLNADQQKNLFDMINGGGGGGDIVVQVDGREIARAVRNQVQQGYKFA